MRYFLFSFTLVAPLLTSAAPARFYGKRAPSDVLVLKFSEVLEQLENGFYNQATMKFQDSDFTAAGFSSSQIPIQQFKNIQSDEASHSQTLQATLKLLGETPVTGCKFDFSSALMDVSTMAATARVIENLGVSAYLGGATLLTDPVLLNMAGSILTVEARHQTILNILSSTGTAIPAAYDIPLTPSEVLAVASPLISGCDIPISANTPLRVTNYETVAPGTLLTFQASTINGTIHKDSMFCQMLVGNASTSIPFPLSQCVVPNHINGPVALFITSDGQPLINNVRDRAQDKIVAGPTIAFIDTKPELLGQLARTTNLTSGTQSTSTVTISPAQASSILAGAGGTSATDSAPAADPTPSSSPSISSSSFTSPSTPSFPAGPILTTGPSADGSIIVNGWNNSADALGPSGYNAANSSSGNATSVVGAPTTNLSISPVVISSSTSSTISTQAPAIVVNSGASLTGSSTTTVTVSSPTFSPLSGPNTITGPSADESIIVNGFSSPAGGSSATSSAATSVVTSPSLSVSPSTSSLNEATGSSADGSIVVNGWSSSS